MERELSVDADGCPSDNVVSAFVEGRLAECDANAVLSHIDGCARCQVIVGALARPRAPLRGRPPRRLARFSVAVGAALLVGVVVSAVRATLQTPCDVRARLAGVWDGATRQELRAAFSSARQPSAPRVGEEVARQLDAYAAAWSGQLAQSCDAPSVSRAVELACLEDRLTDLHALTSRLLSLDARQLQSTVNAVAGLARVERCGDAEVLAAKAAPPSDPLLADKVRALRAELAETRALLLVGDPQALSSAVGNTATAVALAFRPVEAEARLVQARCAMAAGDSAGAEVLLFEAIELAGAARDDELVASAWVEVVSVMSQSPRRGPGSALAIHAARGAINRIGGADGAYEPTLLKARAAILLADHHAPEARALFEEVAGLEERREPGGLRALESVANLAMALSAEGRPAQALPLLQHVVTAIEKKLGPDSEALIAPLRSKASVELELHRDAEAHLTLMRVQALAEASDDQ